MLESHSHIFSFSIPWVSRIRYLRRPTPYQFQNGFCYPRPCRHSSHACRGPRGGCAPRKAIGYRASEEEELQRQESDLFAGRVSGKIFAAIRIRNVVGRPLWDAADTVSGSLYLDCNCGRGGRGGSPTLSPLRPAPGAPLERLPRENEQKQCKLNLK